MCERRRTPPAAGVPLAFDATGGPVVAVCGLVGGAGTSTLAYLLASRAARASTIPVLLAGLDGDAGITAMAGTASSCSLRELAHAVDEGRALARPFAELPDGLRVVAAAARGRSVPPPGDALERVLADARELHGLVVIDAGTLLAPESPALLQSATHVLFVMTATVSAVRQAALLAADDVFAAAAGRPTALVAVATHRLMPPVREVRRLAAAHVDRLLLVPYLDEIVRGRCDHADPSLEDTFMALATLLRRST